MILQLKGFEPATQARFTSSNIEGNLDHQ